jgi:hypothetical protein
MSYEQCWALNADRDRCQEPVEPGQYFCEEHDRGYAFHPLDVFCLSEAEMPPDLVAHLRACSPTWPFPEPSPAIVTLGPAAPAAVPTPLEDAPGAAEPSPAPPVAPPPAESDAAPEPHAWLLAALRQCIEQVMAADVQPIPRASTVARLSGLYLRACRTTELTKENRSLRKQVVEFAARLAAETQDAAPPTRRTPPAGSNGGGGNAAEPQLAEPRPSSHALSLTRDQGSLAGTPTAAPDASRTALFGAGTRAAGGWLDTAFLAAPAFRERPRSPIGVFSISYPILGAEQREKRKQASALQRGWLGK